MYISKINLKNFRNFKNQEIEFNDGVNVIIGHNNSGKTNLIKALSLVIDHQGAKRLDVDDFNKLITLEELQESPPKISIEVTIKQGKNQEPDDLVTIGNWLTKLDETYEAVLTYEFFLPENQKDNYINAINAIQEPDRQKAIEKTWIIIKHDFIRMYTYKIWGGNTINQTIADNESLQKFDFQFLDAIRDVERNMLTGRNALLKEVLDFFIDYDIKSLPESEKSIVEKTADIKQRRQNFSESADILLSHLLKRMEDGKEEILSYAEDTGAAFNNANPNFEGSISEGEMFSALKLIVEYKTGIKIPATHNGLGYNNLIFMSLLLAKMQVNSNGEYLGSNAKVFSTLAIEEPEAHLHPAMQYKFLKFLKENKEQKKVRQIFISTHSTHITSAVSLDEIICLHNENGQTNVGYPGRVFPPDNKSKKYVQRFLDATKSDMLFAQKVILVEGIAEQLLMSIFARYEGKSLEDNHIAVINVGGRFFDHFLYLFDNTNTYTIPKKIACITDRDPERKALVGGNYTKCYPYEYKQDTSNYEYRDNATPKISKYEQHQNIRFFSQDDTIGKTFEYDLVLYNPKLELLITESMSNQQEIKELMRLQQKNKPLSEYLVQLSDSDENKRIKESLSANTSWDEENKKKAIICSRYLNSIGKGENALELAYTLEDNLGKKGKPEYQSFNVPEYIKKAIEWICQ
jgi:putative ATP-dependent endonuclease of OLD family